MSDQHQPEKRDEQVDQDVGEYVGQPAMSEAELEAVLASLDEHDLYPQAPPASVWAGIESQLDETPTRDTTSTSVTTLEAARTERSKRSRRSTVALRWLATAAAVVLVVSGVFYLARRDDETRVVATAQLQYEDGFDAAGASSSASAKLVERDGRYQIALSDPDLPNDLGEPADLELWLIEKRADGSLDVQPVAIIDNGDGTFSVPDGLDPRTHNIVDISIEPRDGDATHSGRSILRGTLVDA